MHPNAALLHRFYESFGRRDAEGMVACYQSDVTFRDPVFGELRGREAGDMWRMLVARAVDLRVEALDMQADDEEGRATWVATYSFGKARRRVRNVVRARFAFRDGRIARHVDEFSLWRWCGMAMGPAGWLFGWAPPVRARVRQTARRGLDAWRRGARVTEA